MGTEQTSDIDSDYHRNSFVPHLLSVAGTRWRARFTACVGGQPRYPGDRTPLVRVSTLHGVSLSGSHLGSTLKPGGAVLTRGVFRRSGSVAYVRADASPNEVLA
ncbi:hypothetical protein MMIN_21200 [Mycolicibacter minnesotensis]|nr:hypothetical protein MMIN_21200 [Mycolicibacter minnesotensis]